MEERTRSSGTSWGVLVAIGLAVATVAIGAYVLLGFAAGNTDRYGRVAVPGAEPVQLESGEVDIFYAEDVSIPDDQSLSVPPNLRVAVTAPSGEPLDIRRRSGQEISGTGGTATLIGSIDAPDDGTYDVAARGAPDAGSRGPEITFGDSPFDEVGDRVENVVGMVIGPIGLGVVGLLAALGIVRWVRRRSTVEAPTLPSDGPGG